MKKIIIITVCLLGLIFFACKKEQIAKVNEPVKDISGSWKIIKATRNGTDLTDRFAFGDFRIKFSDSAYTITNPVPFISSKDGTWRFDDPVYPFQITFAAPGESKTSAFLYPVVNGVRNIVISFSPGCKLNTYQYTLQKDK
jgi:hypothetical protein